MKPIQGLNPRTPKFTFFPIVPMTYFTFHPFFSCLATKLAIRHTFLPNPKLYTQTSKRLCYQTWEGLWNFFKISSSQHYFYSLPFFQNYFKRPFYPPFVYHLPRLIMFFLLKKIVGKNILKIWIKIILRKENSQWSEFAFWREVNGRSWKKIPIRWPMEGSIAWWPMEG